MSRIAVVLYPESTQTEGDVELPRKNRINLTWVRTQVAQIGGVETIANRRFVRAGFEPGQVARTKDFSTTQKSRSDRIQQQWFEPTPAG